MRRRVRFILRAKELGFTLAETKELLELRVTDPDACGDVEATARSKIADVEARIRELDRAHSKVGNSRFRSSTVGWRPYWPSSNASAYRIARPSSSP